MPDEKEIVLKYHGKGAGLTAYKIPGKDLTEADLARLEHVHITRKQILDTGLYQPVRTKRKDKGVKDATRNS